MPWVCRILQEGCTGCGVCVDVCNHGALVMDRDRSYPGAVEGACVGCMDCEKECPFDAILMEETNPEPAMGTAAD